MMIGIFWFSPRALPYVETMCVCGARHAGMHAGGRAARRGVRVAFFMSRAHAHVHVHVHAHAHVHACVRAFYRSGGSFVAG